MTTVDPSAAQPALPAPAPWPAAERSPSRARGSTASTIHELFAGGAGRGSSLALVGPERLWTYAQMEEEANRRARRLRRAGIGPEAVVGILVQDPAERVVNILAVLKAGGAYLLLDGQMPVERLRHMIADAQPAVVVHDEQLPGEVAAVTGEQLAAARLTREAALLPGTALPDTAGPQNAAYVAYTSGTTGGPKGAVIAHAAVVAHCRDFVRRFRPGPADRVPLMASAAFDVAIEEILPALIGGACLVAAGPTPQDMARFTADVRGGQYTILNLPASLWRLWTEHLSDQRAQIPPSVRLVIAGSEEIPLATLHEWLRLPRAQDVQWVAAYGTTETTVTSSVYTDAATDFGGELGGTGTRAAGELVPIGRPIAGTHFHVLDDDGWPVHDGEVGELHIGGAGVARGYIKRPEETERSFVPDPFCGPAGARMYRSGDLVRRRFDGNYVWIGRRDAQLKVHGLRIEPGEIEAVLTQHSDVRRATVVLRRDPTRGGHDELWAFVVSRHPGRLVDAGQMRAHLTRRLPATMVPDHIEAVAQLPLNSNGKLDRAGLRQMPRAEIHQRAAGRHR